MTPLAPRLPLRLAVAAPAAALLAALLATPASGQVQQNRPQEEVGGIVDEPLAEDEARDDDDSAIIGVDADGDGRLDQIGVLQAEDDDDVVVPSVEIGVNFTTSYYFRGIVQQTDGLLNGGIIAQPYVEVGIPLIAPEDQDFLITGTVGIWNSFGSEQEAPETNPEAWYESDLYAGATFETGNLEIFGIYTFYTSPNGSFAVVQEVGGGFAYALSLGDEPDVDDETLFDVTLSAAVFSEIDNTAVGNEEGIYIELGVEPSFEQEIPGIAGDVGISIPVTVGLSAADYYTELGDGDSLGDDGDNDIFGYVSVGAVAEIPLPMPARYGEWTLAPAVEFLYLGADRLAELNEAADNRDDVEFIGNLAVQIEF